jgi:hypothetical protein
VSERQRFDMIGGCACALGAVVANHCGLDLVISGFLIGAALMFAWKASGDET